MPLMWHFVVNCCQSLTYSNNIYSGDKIVTLYGELQSSEMPPHLLVQFEDVLSALLADVKKIDAEKRRMEERITK